MNLLQLKNGLKAYGAREIFTGASFSVNAEEKIGVIGPNGAGKSTLFRILIGDESLDGGEITRANGLRIGYLAQEDNWTLDSTVEDYLVTQSITPIWEIKRLAPSFGLSVGDFDRPIMSLSGGYRMRVKLLHLLASKPDLMLLDEPTNYLDLETLVVLENFLQGASSALMVISHDREFLRRTTNHILEVEAGEMTKYAGQIDDYFEQKELLREQLNRAASSLQAKRKEILDFAAKFGAKATKARQVQSRMKALDRMESIEIKALPVKAKIRVPEPSRTGKVVLQASGVELGYGEKKILRELNIEIQRGDHVGVVGVNGAGKSTFLKALAQELAPLQGSIEIGPAVELAYYAQHVAEHLDPNDSVIQAMAKYACSTVTHQEVLDLAGSLLFSGDTVQKRIRVLSGGEKSRVALGQVLLKRASCLLLDEPTNHLDFDTVEALTQAVAEYSGAVVIVSHDRGFVRRTASKILEIRNGLAEVYPGTYDEYVWSVQKGALSNRDTVSSQMPEVSSTPESSSGMSSGNSSVSNRINYKERRKFLERDLRNSEKNMRELDIETEKCRAEMLALNEVLIKVSGVQAVQTAKNIADLQDRIDKIEMTYLELLESHDAIKTELETTLLANVKKP
jgi:ATP-binding cassette subfamily F protein 3